VIGKGISARRAETAVLRCCQSAMVKEVLFDQSPSCSEREQNNEMRNRIRKKVNKKKRSPFQKNLLERQELYH
jgi:hypothetical protein